ncbi:deoxyribose-phosphate aldolase [Wohlfahrtiimonas sp. G9077]|uniref:deoxyribose-phosphate aldolase n=1 Tax=Wohlfahrtiimonas sp. G9077 TaxID=1980118 RepID=UPI000B98AF50|nr:deoxyribose-phosphate aldolase [Wohlfahrtiimonas sp. G9077]OYQ75319.1 deoxyribose-phosphate aldolase [Wohlfahrtiimonas sp. G9077]
MEAETLKIKVAQKMIGLIDMPYLFLNLDANKVAEEVKSIGAIASITTFAQHVAPLREAFGDAVPTIATIINYPYGPFNTYNATQEMKQALDAGTDEIDLVFPYQALVNRQAGLCLKFLNTMRETAGDTPLKLTIEAGILQDAKWIRKATELAVRSGMNVVKTASGRNRQQITLTMVQMMLTVIEDMNPETGIHIVTTNNNFTEASQYLEEVISRLGTSWVDASHFRLSGPNLVSSISELLAQDHAI